MVDIHGMATVDKSRNWSDGLTSVDHYLLRHVRSRRLPLIFVPSLLIAVTAVTVTLSTFAAIDVDRADPAWHAGLWISIVLPLTFGPLLLFVIVRLLSLLDTAGTELHDLALHDPLTAVLNRRGFKRAFADSNFGQEAHVVLLDINEFKQINDRYGHHFGDTTLKHIAQWLTEMAGPNALVARLGGDEFVAISQNHIVDTGWHQMITADVDVSVSVGATQLGTDLDTALLAADEALYHVKRSVSAA